MAQHEETLRTMPTGTLEEMVLTRVKMGLVTRVGKPLLDSVKIDTSAHCSYIADEIAVRFLAYVTARKMRTTSYGANAVGVPASRFQHFKAAVLPAFALKLWPIKTRPIMQETHVTNYFCCPHADFAFNTDRQNPHMSFLWDHHKLFAPGENES